MDQALGMKIDKPFQNTTLAGKAAELQQNDLGPPSAKRTNKRASPVHTMLLLLLFLLLLVASLLD